MKKKKERSLIEENIKKDKEWLKNANGTDDCFFSMLIKGNKAFVELVFKAVGRTIKPQRVFTQYRIESGSRSVILDALAFDTGRKYIINIEMQKDPDLKIRSRAFHNLSAVTFHGVGKGEDAEELDDAEYITLFFLTSDIFKEGKAYYVYNQRRDNGVELGTGGTYIFINMCYKGDDLIGTIIHDLHCSDPKMMYNRVIRERARFLKDTKHGGDTMQSSIARFRKEGREEGLLLGEERGILIGEKRGIKIGEERGIQIGEINAKKDVARNMKESGMPMEQIAKWTGLSIAEVNTI